MNITTFCLGAISVMVLVLLVAMIVMIIILLRLNKKVFHQENVQIEIERSIERTSEDLQRSINSQITEVYRTLDDKVQDFLITSKSYTDSRIDKLSERIK